MTVRECLILPCGCDVVCMSACLIYDMRKKRTVHHYQNWVVCQLPGLNLTGPPRACLAATLGNVCFLFFGFDHFHFHLLSLEGVDVSKSHVFLSKAMIWFFFYVQKIRYLFSLFSYITIKWNKQTQNGLTNGGFSVCQNYWSGPKIKLFKSTIFRSEVRLGSVYRF